MPQEGQCIDKSVIPSIVCSVTILKVESQRRQTQETMQQQQSTVYATLHSAKPHHLFAIVMCIDKSVIPLIACLVTILKVESQRRQTQETMQQQSTVYATLHSAKPHHYLFAIVTKSSNLAVFIIKIMIVTT